MAFVKYARSEGRAPGEHVADPDNIIHDARAIVGYFAFVNRIADGLGVQIEGSWPTRPPAPSSAPETSSRNRP